MAVEDRQGPLSSVMTRTRNESIRVERLREGDDEAFADLVDRHHRAMLRLAETFVSDRATAEEVVQETWTAVIDGLEDFEGHSSLKTWMFSILTNLAKKRGQQEARTVTWSSLSEESIDREVTEESDRFDTEGRWSVPPVPWNTDPEEELMRSDLLERLEDAIEQLPDRQKAVVTLRDIEGWSASEVCDVLDITDGNQRVLLHRGRQKMRETLESYWSEQKDGVP